MGHQFKKYYGQNFLRNKKFVKKIVEDLDLSEDDLVIEIGPGEGILTSELVETKAQVVSIEIDYSLIPKLIKRFNNYKNYDIVHEDFLAVNLSDLLKKYGRKNIKVTGSLPYNISKKIIAKLLDFNFSQEDYKIESMCFIVQEEVAIDYVAIAPKASFLSNYVRVFTNVKKLETIPASQFYPTPKVNGAILLLKPKEQIPQEFKEILKLMRIGFVSPRKVLARNIKNSQKWEIDNLTKIFEELEIKDTARAAEIEHEKWEKLLEKLNGKS